MTPTDTVGWPELLDRIAADERFNGSRTALLAAAQDTAALRIVRRARRLDEVGKFRTFRDSRCDYLDDATMETFALAMSDLNQGLAEEMMLLAAAYRLNGDAAIGQRVLDQLEEMAGWSPLQRPGWTLYDPAHRLPPDGKDGNWLGTGLNARAICNTLDILPHGTVPETLESRLHEVFAREIPSIVDDWESRRPWFVQHDNPVTNQWVLPTEGLIRACILLGIERNHDAYEMGVSNLLRALDAHGQAGEFEEGIAYATVTVTSMVHTAHAMALAGDDRALQHPYLHNFALWMVHHIQPGRFLINSFDCFWQAIPRRGLGPHRGEFRGLLALLAVCAGNKVARWAIADQFDTAGEDLASLAAMTLPPVVEPPPLFAYYDRARRVSWRNRWNDDASGVWIRGGHELDQHDHQDRGHVNFIAHGKPILIEAGTPAYHNPDLTRLYCSGAGHNVLQVGTAMPKHSSPTRWVEVPGWQLPRGVAPLRVDRLDTEGGNVTVDGTRCYSGVERWTRRVQWNANVIDVTDEVILVEGTEDFILFRWHLGTTALPDIACDGELHEVQWDRAVMTITASEPLDITVDYLPDHTLTARAWNDESPDHLHACVIVTSREPLHQITSRTITYSLRDI